MRLFLDRLYFNFIMPSKVNEYARILAKAKECGYQFHSVLSFENVRNSLDKDSKYLILRCDVDTPDYKVLKLFLKYDIMYGASSSYYFRLNTVNYKLMREINKAGGEASYHYEEIATYCYKKKIKNKILVDDNIDKIRILFERNYLEFKRKSALPCYTIASHGEFINIKLGVPNHYLIDSKLKSKLGIVREAYDKEHMEKLTCRVADHCSSDFIKDSLAAIERGEHVIELLTHPRQWRSAAWINLKMDLSRLYRGIRYKLF